jgi:hypothetical protein
MDIGSPVEFTKFDGGTPVRAVGTLTGVSQESATVSYEGVQYEFRRAPGSKSGYGVGRAKFWRLGMEERKSLCHPDIPTKRR